MSFFVTLAKNIIYHLSLLKTVMYFSCKYFRIHSILRSNGCANIKAFRIKNWHHGFAYFYAYRHGEKVFIKVDTKLNLLGNEKSFYSVMQDDISKYLVPLYFFYESGSLQLACFRYEEGSKELGVDIILNNFDYLEEIIHLLTKINKKSLIHRDIKLDNFLLVNGDLKIIDFTFSYSLDGSNKFKTLDPKNDYNINILRKLGGKYKAGLLKWNDMVSLSKIIDEIKCSGANKEQIRYLNGVTQEINRLSKGKYYQVEP